MLSKWLIHFTNFDQFNIVVKIIVNPNSGYFEKK